MKCASIVLIGKVVKFLTGIFDSHSGTIMLESNINLSLCLKCFYNCHSTMAKIYFERKRIKMRKKGKERRK